jgi:hypothetical protein
VTITQELVTIGAGTIEDTQNQNQASAESIAYASKRQAAGERLASSIHRVLSLSESELVTEVSKFPIQRIVNGEYVAGFPLLRVEISQHSIDAQSKKIRVVAVGDSDPYNLLGRISEADAAYLDMPEVLKPAEIAAQFSNPAEALPAAA